MRLSEDDLQIISKDPVAGLLRICEQALQDAGHSPDGFSDDDVEILLETSIAVAAVASSKGIDLESTIPELQNYNSNNDNGTVFWQYLNEVIRHLRAQNLANKAASIRAHYAREFGTVFCYEFSQGDLERIQELLNELRKSIQSNCELEDEHKQRLLARLENLQRELHKKVSDLDRFWGLLGDAGVALGKLGEGAKPIVSLIKELVAIVWKTQARKEELPSSAENPALPNLPDE